MTEDTIDRDDSWLATRLQRWRAGDRQALAELFDYYRAALKNMVQLRIGEQLAARIDASDVMQEAYVDAERKGDEYLRSPRVEFYVWLRGVTRDRLLKLQRLHLGAEQRAAQREVRLPDGSSLALAQQLIGGERSPSAEARRRELRDLVRRAIQLLPKDDREVILMRHFEGLSNAQVAQSLDLKPSAATMRHGRALVRLHGLLAAELSRGDLQ